jgi:hypothetical protein
MQGVHRFDEIQPPWVAFPDLTIETFSRHLTQGLVEAWVDQHWRPFWASLDREERTAYLDYWDASPEWREAVEFFFEPDPNFDAESDAAESREYLASAREERREPRRSLLGRIFKRG